MTTPEYVRPTSTHPEQFPAPKPAKEEPYDPTSAKMREALYDPGEPPAEEPLSYQDVADIQPMPVYIVQDDKPRKTIVRAGFARYAIPETPERVQIVDKWNGRRTFWLGVEGTASIWFTIAAGDLIDVASFHIDEDLTQSLFLGPFHTTDGIWATCENGQHSVSVWEEREEEV